MQASASEGRRCGRWVMLGAALLCSSCASGPEQPEPASAPLPDHEPVRELRAVPQASPLVKQGEARLQASDPAGAQALFERAIAEDANDARAHLDLGIAREMQGDPQGAAAAYREAIAIAPEFAEALNNLGVLLRDRGELDEAVPLLERAVRANPGSAAAQANLALALEDRGDLARAEAAYRAALEIEPEALMTRANLGLLLVARGEHAAAVQELRRALAGAQGNRAALVAIGNGLRRAGDAETALRAMQAAMEAEEEVTPALLSELALAQRASGDREAAIATLERALSLDARYATAHYLLANMLAAAQRTREAKRHYQRYLALEPRGPQAAQARERLEVLERR